MPPAAPRPASATRTTGAPAGYKPDGGGRTILGLKPKTALLAGGGVLAAALVYFWWRGRQAKPTSTSTTASAGTYAGGFERYVYGTSTSTGTGSGGGGGGGTGSTGTGTKKSTSTGTTTKKSTGTATKTTPPPTTKPKVTAPKMPAGVRAAKTTSNAVTLTWAKDATATSYRVRVTYQGKLVGSPQQVNGTSATVSGLTADHTYTFHVAAINAGGTSPETNGPAVKTTR